MTPIGWPVMGATDCDYWGLSCFGWAKVLVATCLLATSLEVGEARAQGELSGEIASQDIVLRDRLIADQEALLNSYRCRFNIDTHAVPGGCVRGEPSQPASKSGPVPENPTKTDIAVRDRLIADQEALLNSYRCRFNIDTHAVTEGCPFASIAAGGAHSCGLRTDGTITCWGDDYNGQSTPPEGQFIDIAAGFTHSCGLRTDGAITCWGSNWYGESTSPEGDFIAIAAGDNPGYSCGIRDGGSLICWGDSQHGYRQSPPSGKYTAVSVGNFYSCALRTSGAVACWGDRRWPAPAPKGKFTAVSADNSYGCGIKTDGTIACWSDNPERMRNWDWNRAGQATPPDGIFASIATSRSHSCGISISGTIGCWGDLYKHGAPPMGNSLPSLHTTTRCVR